MQVVQLRSANPEFDPRVTRIFSAVAQQGWRSQICYWNRGIEGTSAPSINCTTVFSTPTPLANPPFLAMPFLLAVFYLRCIIFLIKMNPRVCFAHQLDVLPPALFLRSLKRDVKVVFDNEDVYSLMISNNTPRVLQAMIHAIERQLAGRADLCIFPNSAMRNYIGLQDDHKTLIVPNLPENDFVHINTLKRVGVRRTSQPFTLVYFGFMARYRGLENLIKAIEIVTSQGVKVSCSLVGDGPIISQLRNLAKESEMDDRVRFLGRVTREMIPALVASFDASVILNSNKDPMNWIGDPNKLYECMALGVPVLASDFGEIAEIVRTTECGVLVNPDDPKSIADGILRLSDNAALRRRLSKNGVEATRTRYSWERVKRNLVETIRELATSPD